ncbi:MAG: threonine synthase [Treponema sp.]|nr:threonine synthase [Treponema sp.]
MQFTSTRNSDLSVMFSKAVQDCIPADGGVFVPSQIQDMRRWIYYIDETTPFSSIAGSLTSALMHEEFSPIICETIATDAFPNEPIVTQLDDNLFSLELYHGYTGYHKDYGVAYLCSYLEATLTLKGGNVIFLDYTHGGLGALLAKLLKGKKHLKAVLVYKKGTVRGIDEESLAWNGGNIYPVEMEGSEADIKAAVNQVFQDRAFVENFGLTVADSTNVCRLLGQMFFYPYSFAQIKKKVSGDIYYAMGPENYGTLMAGLYSWRFALPVSGFFMPSSPALYSDPKGNPVVMDSLVQIERRGKTNPVSPANIERLEAFFRDNQLMMRNFVFPVDVSEKEREKAAKELYMKYGLFSSPETAEAYAVIREKGKALFEEDAAVVLISHNHPALSADYCRHVIGEVPEIPESIKESLRPTELNRPHISSVEDIKAIIKAL